MRTLPVILLQEKIKTVLLASVRWLWWDILLKGSMHPFITSVLAGLSRFDPLGAETRKSIHRLDNSLTPPMASEAKGAPLSVRIASGRPYSRNAHSNQGLTAW